MNYYNEKGEFLFEAAPSEPVQMLLDAALEIGKPRVGFGAPERSIPITLAELKKMQDYHAAQLKQCREAALIDAMNATLPFGKTGAVIAAAIGALK